MAQYHQLYTTHQRIRIPTDQSATMQASRHSCGELVFMYVVEHFQDRAGHTSCHRASSARCAFHERMVHRNLHDQNYYTATATATSSSSSLVDIAAEIAADISVEKSLDIAMVMPLDLSRTLRWTPPRTSPRTLPWTSPLAWP